MAAKLVPTETMWVMRGQNGLMEEIAVTAMTDHHIYRWIRYFRRKLRDEGWRGETHTDADLDIIIKATMVTAPAIYAEAEKRGMFPGSMLHAKVPGMFPGSTPMPPTTSKTRQTEEVPLGTRRITLDEDD